MSFQHEPSPTKFDRHQSPGDHKGGPSWRLVLAVLLAAAIVAWVIANGHQTRIDFVFFKWDTTVRWSIFIAAVLGAALDRLFVWGRRRHKKEQAKDLLNEE